jgi:DNA-binding response OmpR family regulator
MNGTILVYGNEPMLVKTRGLILEKAGYEVLASTALGGAMLTLMTQQVDVLLLCQSLADEERRGILETAHALQPEIKCAVLDFEERENTIDGVDLVRGLAGPSALLSAVGNLLTQKAATQTM